MSAFLILRDTQYSGTPNMQILNITSAKRSGGGDGMFCTWVTGKWQVRVVIGDMWEVVGRLGCTTRR